MIKKVLWVLISCLMVLSLILASCGPKEEEEEEITPPPGEEEEVTPPTTGGNWWDKFGEPEYGGTLNLAAGSLPTTFDPANFTTSRTNGFFDQLFIWDWAVDRELHPFKTLVVPIKYIRGLLVETWDWEDPQTLILNIRQDVYYQDKPPANGRKLTAQDIEYHFDRALGTGSGFTEPNPSLINMLAAFEKVTALDDYTVQVKFKSPSLINNWNGLTNPGNQVEIENPETIQQYGPLVNDWHYAVGTGPFILTDYITASTMTLTPNPNYWGYDERYPENKLPYLDRLRVLTISDASSVRAAIRAGKIDLTTNVSLEGLQELTSTNPDLIKAEMPANTWALELRTDMDPFTDIRVRKALQMAIDRETIAATYYGGIVDGKPCCFLSPYTKGYCYDYSEWPQELKDEYSYNPTRAKELLAEAGYPNGFKTNVVSTSGGQGQDLLEILQSYFQAINVDMELRLMESVAFSNFVFSGKQDQMIFRGWWGMIAPVDVPIGDFYSKYPANVNTTRASNADYDALYEEFKIVQDEDEAQRILREAQKISLENHWKVGLFPLVSFNVWEPYLKGYSGELAFLFQQYWYWARLWIDQDLKKSMGF
jgi:peptide/nickel transport system substrate-binding protein